MESRDLMVFFQIDKDWHYRKEERRWDPMNDQSSWRRVAREGRRVVESVFPHPLGLSAFDPAERARSGAESP